MPNDTPKSWPYNFDTLSTCWSYEMNCPPERIAPGIQVGMTFRRYAEQL